MADICYDSTGDLGMEGFRGFRVLDCTMRNEQWMLAPTDQVGAQTQHVPTDISEVVTT